MFTGKKKQIRMDISIIIVSYNSGNILKDCLLSIIKNHTDNNPSVEIIVVENYQKQHNTQVIINELVDASAIPIIFIQNPTNGGFGQGNNLGVQHSSGENLFFLNPDTIITDKNTFSTIHSSLICNDIIVGFKLLTPTLQINHSYSVFPEYFFLYPLIRILHKKKFFLPNKISLLNHLIWPWGAAFALKRETFIQCGMFDPQIFLCYEEPYLMRRITNRQIKLLNISIIHLEGHNQIVSQERMFSSLQSLDYYCHKYRKPFKRIFFHMYFYTILKTWLCPKNQNLLNLKRALIQYKSQIK